MKTSNKILLTYLAVTVVFTTVSFFMNLRELNETVRPQTTHLTELLHQTDIKVVKTDSVLVFRSTASVHAADSIRSFRSIYGFPTAISVSGDTLLISGHGYLSLPAVEKRIQGADTTLVAPGRFLEED